MIKMMTLTLNISFHEPFCGAWVSGQRKLGVKDELDAKCTQDRYTAYFKDTYGATAKVTRLNLQEY